MDEVDATRGSMGRGYEIVTRGSPSTCCGDSMEVKPRTSGGAARASSSVAATSHSADVIMLRFASRASAWVLSDGDESGLGHSSRHRLVAVRYPKISSMSRGDCAQRRETEEGGKTPHTTRLTLSSSDSERERERERERELDIFGYLLCWVIPPSAGWQGRGLPPGNDEG